MLFPVAFAHRLATGREAALSGTAIAFLYVVAKVSSLFSLVGLAYTGEGDWAWGGLQQQRRLWRC